MRLQWSLSLYLPYRPHFARHTPCRAGHFRSFPTISGIFRNRFSPDRSALLRLFHVRPSLSPNYPSEPMHFGANTALVSLYYNINSAREKVLFLNFWHICQKHCYKNVRYGKNASFFLQSPSGVIIISLLCVMRWARELEEKCPVTVLIQKI